MLTRQRIVLRLLADAGGNCTKLQLMKLCFLLGKEGRSEQLKTFYEFVPYLYGPYSFTLTHEIDNLVREGCVRLPQTEWVELTTGGKRAMSQGFEVRLARDIEIVGQKYGALEHKKLIETVYEKYPWFTANSKFANKRKAKFVPAPCANYTIGYQAFQVDGLLNRLLESGVSRLLDTRNNPVSRRYGYHKSTLLKLCEGVGIHYEHLPEVGIPSSWRQELDSDAEYKQLFRRYEREILDKHPTALRQIADRMAEMPSALLCREAMASQCHRSILAKRLEQINGYPVIDLGSMNVKDNTPLLDGLVAK